MSGVATITDRQPDRRLEWLREQLARDLVPARGSRYVVKPNLSSGRPASTGATTDADVVRAVVRHLLDHGARVAIVELPPHVRNIERVVALTGYRDLARELGVPLVIPDTAAEFVTAGRLFRALPCRVARAAWEADGIVNVPKVKTHVRAHFTAAVKNLVGLADMTTRHNIHVWGLHRGIVDLYRTLEPCIALNVLDAGVAMEGQGPTRGDPLPLDTLWVGRDAVACDLHAAAATGIDVEQVPYLARLAASTHAALGPAPQRLGDLSPAAHRHPRLDYLREALTTQPVLRRVLQRIDFDHITEKRPVLPPGDTPLDHLCPHGAIRGRTLSAERCTSCHECLGDASVVLESGASHRARVLRELLGSGGGRS